MNHENSPLETLAIAYLTGHATPAQVKEYNRLYATDMAFVVLVKDLENWLAPLNAETLDRDPPADLFESIMSDIDKDEGAAKIVPTATNDNTKFWKALAIAASLVACISIGSHFIGANKTMPTPASSPLMALMTDASQPNLVAIIYNPDTQQVVARLSNVTLPDQGDFELWLIREGNSAPISLGVVPQSPQSELAPGPVTFDIAETLQVGTDTLAISLEEPGGSKAAGPQGPILYTGVVSDLT